MPNVDLVELRRPDARLDLALPAAELILGIGQYRATQTIDSIMGEMRDRTTIVAVEDDEVIATAGLSVVRPGVGSVEDVITDPDWRGEGIGRLVVGAVEDLAERKRIAELQLTSSLLAMPFYEHLGYEQLDQDGHTYRKFL